MFRNNGEVTNEKYSDVIDPKPLQEKELEISIRASRWDMGLEIQHSKSSGWSSGIPDN